MILSQKTKQFLALSMIYLVWGSTFLAVKYAILDFPPMLLSGVRFFVGGLLLLLFSLAQEKKLPSFKLWKGPILIGVMLSGIGNCVVANALNYMPSGIVALLVATIPIWILLLDYLLFSKIPPSKLAILGLFLGFFGMVFLLNPMGNASIESEIVFWPTLIVFVGSVSWAYGTLLSPRLEMPANVPSTAIQMLAGGLFSLILSMFLENHQLDHIKNASMQTFWAMTYLIFIGSFVGYSAYNWLVNNVSPEVVATYAYVNPVVALFLGWIYLDETLSSRSLISAVIILFGVVLMTLGKKKTS